PARQRSNGPGRCAQRVRQGRQDLSNYWLGMCGRHGPLLRIEAMSMRNILALSTGCFVLVFIMTAPNVVLAQGSAGGSIGNDDKSVSGSRSAPRAVEPDRSAAPRRSKPDADAPRQATRKSGGGGGGGGNFDGTWSYVGVGTNCQGTGAGSFTVSGSRVS